MRLFPAPDTTTRGERTAVLEPPFGSAAPPSPSSGNATLRLTPSLGSLGNASGRISLDQPPYSLAPTIPASLLKLYYHVGTIGTPAGRSSILLTPYDITIMPSPATLRLFPKVPLPFGPSSRISILEPPFGLDIPVTAPTPPGVFSPAACTPNPVTATTAALSVLGSDALGESTLTYTWSTTSKPSGATDPSFSANGTNAAKNCTVTLYKAGSYTFLATITNSSGLTATSSVKVGVSQTTSSLSVTPSSTTVYVSSIIPYTATATDQFGFTVSPAPTFTWSKTSGVGSIDSSTGIYTAPDTPGSATISVSVGAVSGPASVTIVTVPPPSAPSTRPTGGSPVSSSGTNPIFIKGFYIVDSEYLS